MLRSVPAAAARDRSSMSSLIWRHLRQRHLSTSPHEPASTAAGDGTRKRSWGLKAVRIGLISLAGGLVLSTVNDLAIFHGCSGKAIEKANKHPGVTEALGLPIVRGPWYDATLAISRQSKSASCTFPVSGPQGSGIFHIKAIRHGETGIFSFLRHHDWEILLMEALLHVPGNDEKTRTLRIDVMDTKPHQPATSSADSHILQSE